MSGAERTTTRPSTCSGNKAGIAAHPTIPKLPARGRHGRGEFLAHLASRYLADATEYQVRVPLSNSWREPRCSCGAGRGPLRIEHIGSRRSAGGARTCGHAHHRPRWPSRQDAYCIGCELPQGARISCSRVINTPLAGPPNKWQEVESRCNINGIRPSAFIRVARGAVASAAPCHTKGGEGSWLRCAMLAGRRGWWCSS